MPGVQGCMVSLYSTGWLVLRECVSMFFRVRGIGIDRKERGQDTGGQDQLPGERIPTDYRVQRCLTPSRATGKSICPFVDTPFFLKSFREGMLVEKGEGIDRSILPM